MILTKTIVRNYFKQNVGFYLLIFMLAFGFMKGPDHKHLILSILQAPYMLVYVSIVWFLHVLKTNFFFRQNLTDSRNRFLKDIVLAKSSFLISELLSAQMVLNQPFLLYALAMVILGFVSNLILPAILIIFIQIALVLIPALHLYFEIKRTDEPQTSIFSLKWLPSLPQHIWFISYLFRKQPLLILSLKFFSWCIIYGTAQLFPTDEYDFRLLNLGIWILSLGQFVLGQEYYRYFIRNVFFEKNLPISMNKRLSYLLLLSLILSIPEFYLISANWWQLISISDWLSAYLYFLSLQTFWIIFQFKVTHTEDKTDLRVFTALGLIFFLIMFKVNLALIGAVFLIWGCFIYKSRYQNSESF